jgi:hypothetical protein
MKTINELIENNGAAETLRWGLIGLAAAIAVLLASSLETGRLHAQAASEFVFTEARVRVITPNGDRKNDVAILCFDNPQHNGVRGEIFSLRGRKVTEMEFVEDAGGGRPNDRGCPIDPAKVSGSAEALTWDGKAGGRAVRSGVYIYVIKAEDKAVTGTILVVR